MKKLLSTLFATVLVLSACGGSDEADDAATVAVDGDATESTDTESTDTESADAASSDDTESTSDEEAEPADDTNDDTGDSADETAASDDSGSSDLSDDEAALAAALTAEDLKDGDVPFTDAEVQCVNEGVVKAVGVDALNGYGISVDTPDSSLLPNEYDVQVAAFAPLTDCLTVGDTFRALAPGCDIELSDEQFDLAFEYDFLGYFPEYDNPAAEEAALALEAAIAACDGAG